MDEVKAMARAGESVGKAVGTGIKTARRNAKRAGEVGVALSRHAAALAEQELASRGISTEDLQEKLAQRTTGMSRDELVKQSRRARKRWEKKAAASRKQFAKNTAVARRELAERISPHKPKRRKWPWVLLVLAGLAAAAAVAFSRRPEELPVASADNDFTKRDTPARHRAEVPAQTDGQQRPTSERSH
ncbi:hypothetical protein SAMN05421805_103305 [Saccharopolyspora antimicrobica]|uniref:Uncharacterized protein n=1 Tax=Saccharopolyspora antimicrobica TaxID=455193 RepID=A0A1I4X9X5_9PSEU|nr:hypothetical protein [Saccharopolyspora antimicrobica]RKT84376.1 hypothetical protein ATL45_2689 [Saccharopolyspora antimicrobica]SFN22110.1 hypothetical protein SAMN05421805_103305 [Saccharopolyspora antimicrobica]